ncbi:MAG TPA: hypothetical protein VHI98_06865 [Vicinamibacterales bacterium]|jgi:hypothetical protein|nr:hypothetical protein [Vicinamibacterales bacterium]
MKPVLWMVGLSLTSWAVIAGVFGRETGLAALAGLLAPLVVASVTWMLMERTYHRNPAGLTPLMVKAFAGKMIFFGAYVAVVLRASSIRPIPFIVSFTGYFIGLHVMEAICLRRLVAGGLQS